MQHSRIAERGCQVVFVLHLSANMFGVDVIIWCATKRSVVWEPCQDVPPSDVRWFGWGIVHIPQCVQQVNRVQHQSCNRLVRLGRRVGYALHLSTRRCGMLAINRCFAERSCRLSNAAVKCHPVMWGWAGSYPIAWMSHSVCSTPHQHYKEHPSPLLRWVV